jgi:1-acyl-sn-glycerol-3-phosphate acyltransferase
MNTNDNPYEVKEIRFWSIRTIPKFIFRGIPRLIMILILYIIVFFLTIFFNENNQSLINKTLKWSSRIKLYFFGYHQIDISSIDLERIQKSNSQIIFAKHSSYIDLLLMAHLFPDAKFIASEYISRIPIIRIFGKSKCIYLKNEFGGNLTDEIQAELDKGTKIVFFGEGVCSNPKFLLKLRNGAFVPKMNILPVHIDYGDNYWVMGEQDMVLHAFTQMSNSRNHVKVRVIPDYQVTEEDRQGDIEIFKENFRKYYANGLGINLSEKSYKDHPYFKLKI